MDAAPLNDSQLEAQSPPWSVVLDKARAAQRLWQSRTLEQRRGFFEFLLEGVKARRDALALEIHRCTGKPRFEALSTEVFPVLALLDRLCRYAGSELSPRRSWSSWPELLQADWEWRALGVVVLRARSTQPLHCVMAELLPALFAGNAVVAVLDARSQSLNRIMSALLDEAGFPGHLYQAFVGDEDTAKRLLECGVDQLSVHCPSEESANLAALCGATLTPARFHVRSQALAVVLRQASLLRASRSLLWSAVADNGSGARSVRRVLVEEGCASHFESLILAEAERLRSGIDQDFRVDLGPLAEASQVTALDALVAECRDRGWPILCGGFGEFSQRDQAHYYAPTIIKVPLGAAPLEWDRDLLDVVGPVLFLQWVPGWQEAQVDAQRASRQSLLSVWASSDRRARRFASDCPQREMAFNHGGRLSSLGLSLGQSVPLALFPGSHPLFSMRPRLLSSRRWKFSENPFWFPYDRLKYRVLSDLLGDVFARNPIQRGKALLQAFLSLSSSGGWAF